MISTANEASRWRHDASEGGNPNIPSAITDRWRDLRHRVEMIMLAPTRRYRRPQRPRQIHNRPPNRIKKPQIWTKIYTILTLSMTKKHALGNISNGTIQHVSRLQPIIQTNHACPKIL